MAHEAQQAMDSLAQNTLREIETFTGILETTSQEVTGLTRQETEDASLAHAVARHDLGSEDRFARRYRSQICSMLIKMTGDPARAEDLTHDTLILVLKKLRNDELSKPHKLSSYVMSTAKFTFYGWLRKKDNQLELMESLNDYVHELDSPEEEYLREESSGEIRALVDTLNVARDREILTRAYFDDQCKHEICEVMELSKEHYDRVISRARNRLKESITA